MADEKTTYQGEVPVEAWLPEAPVEIQHGEAPEYASAEEWKRLGEDDDGEE